MCGYVGIRMRSFRRQRKSLKKRESYRSFFDATGGGITFSGGEPLAQPEFLEAALREAKQKGLHTVIDTAGSVVPKNIDQILDYTDLVLLDIKHIDDATCRILTGRSNANTLAFAKRLAERNIPVWIRHVLVPGLTMTETFLRQTGEFIRTLGNVERVEVLPYHQLGVYKWESLGLDYPLRMFCRRVRKKLRLHKLCLILTCLADDKLLH